VVVGKKTEKMRRGAVCERRTSKKAGQGEVCTRQIKVSERGYP